MMTGLITRIAWLYYKEGIEGKPDRYHVGPIAQQDRPSASESEKYAIRVNFVCPHRG